MKKNKFLLLITILLVLLVGLALSVQNKTSPASEEVSTTDTSSAVQSNIEVTNYTKEQISKLTITQGGKNLSFIPNGENWCIEGLSDTANLNTAAIKVLCDNLLTLDAFKQIDASNLEDFGLTIPSKIITYTFTDGSTKRILLGNNTPDNRSVYLMQEDTSKLFLITSSMADSFKGDVTLFRTTELDKFDASTVTALKASGKDLEPIEVKLNDDISAYTTAYLLKLSNGTTRDMSTTNFVELLKLIPSPIIIENFVADDVTDLSSYGLDNPTLDLYIQNTTTETDPETNKAKDVVTEIHYLWGNTTEDGQVYFMKAGTQSVYSMNSDFLAPLLKDFNPFYLSAKFTQLTNIADVIAIDISLSGQNYTLKIDNDTYMLNDKKLSADDFKAIYKRIIGISADTEFKEATLAGDSPIATFTFTSTEGEKTTYTYYPYDKQFYQTNFKGTSVVGCNIKQFTYLKDCLDADLGQ